MEILVQASPNSCVMLALVAKYRSQVGRVHHLTDTCISMGCIGNVTFPAESVRGSLHLKCNYSMPTTKGLRIEIYTRSNTFVATTM